MTTPITATFPTLNFPKEVDYPTQEDWAAFSAEAELNYGILSGEWSDKSEEFKAQVNNLAQEIQDIGENAINAITFDNIAQLKLNSNMGRVDVLGYYNKGDGGGGTFYWDSTSTKADNGGTIIQATGISTGRWNRVFSGAVNVKWFGAKGNGIDDDTIAIQNVINYDDNLTGEFSVYFPKGTYLTSSKITFSINKTYFGDGEQSTILSSSFAGDWGYYITAPGSSPTRSKFKNISFRSNLTASGTFFSDSTYGLNEFLNCTFSHSGTGSIGTALRLRSTINTIDNCIFTCVNGSGKYGLQLDSQYNKVNNCWFDEFNGVGLFIKGYINTISNSHFQDATYQLILLDTGSHDNSFSNCMLINGGTYAPAGILLRNFGTENKFNGCKFITNSVLNSILDTSAVASRGLIMLGNSYDVDSYTNTGIGGGFIISNTLTADNNHPLYTPKSEYYPVAIRMGVQSGTNNGTIYNANGAVIKHNNGDEWTLNKIRGDDVANGRIIRGTSGIGWFTGTGTPEGVVTAVIGSIYTRIDGGASTTLYVKQSGTGNTGWVAK